MEEGGAGTQPGLPQRFLAMLARANEKTPRSYWPTALDTVTRSATFSEAGGRQTWIEISWCHLILLYILSDAQYRGDAIELGSVLHLDDEVALGNAEKDCKPRSATNRETYG